MSKIETAVTISVYPDPEYHFNVTAGDILFYVEYIENGADPPSRISFGSPEEMRAVALAMLKAVEVDSASKV